MTLKQTELEKEILNIRKDNELFLKNQAQKVAKLIKIFIKIAIRTKNY